MLVISIVVATYGLVAEKQIAIEFVRKELVGAHYLQALQPAYATILTDEREATPIAQTKSGINDSLDALFAAEADTSGSLNTAEFEQSLATALRELLSNQGGVQKQELSVDALGRARYQCDKAQLKANLSSEGAAADLRINEAEAPMLKPYHEGKGWTGKTDNTYTGPGGSKRD